MNYYQIFYLLTRGDSIKNFFDVFSDIFTWFAVISTIYFVIVRISINVNDENWAFEEKLIDDKEQKVITPFGNFVKKTSGGFFYVSLVFCFISWLGYVLVPTKKEMLIIAAAGGTMEYLAADSSAKEIPKSILNFVNTELKTLSLDAQIEFENAMLNKDIQKELLDLPKEQLLERLKTDSVARRILLE